LRRREFLPDNARTFKVFSMKKSLMHAAALLGTMSVLLAVRADEALVLFGSHRSGSGIGFSVARFNTVTGTLTRPEFVEEAEAPSFFVVHPDGKHIYACNSIDTWQGRPEGSISAYAVDAKTGKLTQLNRKPSGGAEPCYVSLDRTGRYVLEANYNGGNVSVFRIEPDGSLGERTAFDQETGSSVNPDRQNRSYAHCIVVDPGNRFALACNLGADKVFVYRFNASDGALTPNDPPAVALKPGSGPRHITFHPNGKFAFVINELASTITAFRWDPEKGTLTELQTISTLPADFKGFNTCAEIQVHPNGKFLYGTNRGHNSLAAFAIDIDTGRLTFIECASTRGKMPRNFTFDPGGKWILLSNHDSDNAVVFRVDDRTGRPDLTGQPVEVPNPFCLRFLATPVQP
jgi:6-phosphogluconolactonase